MQRFEFEALAVLNPGSAQGRLLKLDDALSFWGGFDPANGRILDRAHPQAGVSISGTVLALPASRGSAGTPGGVAEALRCKVGPAAILLLAPDVNITCGAQVADYLYQTSTPVLWLAKDDFKQLETGLQVSIEQDRVILKRPA